MGKEITIYDIVRQLSLSTAMVSRALSNCKVVSKDTTMQILRKAKEMGYRFNNFADNPGFKKFNTIGIILHRLDSDFVTSVLAGIENKTTKAGHDIIITNSGESYEKEITREKIWAKWPYIT